MKKKEIIEKYEKLLHGVIEVKDKGQREKWTVQEELSELQSLLELQHKRSVEADKLWQKAHDKPKTWPDLGKLLEWLIKKATETRCCRNCNSWTGGIQPSCGGCAYMLKDPANGKDMWTERKVK